MAETIWLVLVWLLIIGGIIALFLSIMCLFNQSLLERMGVIGQQILVDINKNMVKNRKFWGVVYLIVGVILVYFGYLTLKLL
ncbi:MAG: hypothetical protein B6D56_04415 [Candidatus Omnitrophica bacterium 4484_70.1]|nr:MAG: hypothetical protein B6D56_04415 [Candidatus Omnitrophica bacterium 4484_70.1]